MSSTNRNRRLAKEIQDISKDQLSGISVFDPKGRADIDDFTHLKGVFQGPPDTPYEGGRYEVDIRITSDYPFKPPSMRFITKIWHPNVSSQTGAICLDTLAGAWSPVLTLKSALISLQSLLSSPEPKDPQDAEVASMLLTRPDEFAHVAREWAVRYASAPRPEPGSGKTSGGPSIAGAADDATIKAKREADEKERAKNEEKRRREAYRGFNPAMVDRFASMGFAVEQVVDAFNYVGLDNNDGVEYELDEAYMGDVTARLFGEM